MLNSVHPAVAIPVPPDSETGPVDIELREVGGSLRLKRSMDVKSAARLDLTSFPEFGPHRIFVTVDFAGSVSTLLAIDLAPECDPERIGTVFLTTAATQKEWTYLATTPLRAGYRYRIHANSGEAVHPWSEVQAHDAPLRLKAPQGRSAKSPQ